MISQHYSTESINNGLLKNTFIENINSTNWSVLASSKDPFTRLKHINKKETISADTTVGILNYYGEVYNKSFDSILIAGLGLGVLAYLCQSFCSTVDVVEIDSELIQLVSEKSYLNNNVSIINKDIFDFTTDKKYDIICLDIWLMDKPSDFNDQINLLQTRFENNLTENGMLYIPIINCYKNS